MIETSMSMSTFVYFYELCMTISDHLFLYLFRAGSLLPIKEQYHSNHSTIIKHIKHQSNIEMFGNVQNVMGNL